jgi:cell division protein FtsW
VVRTRDVDRLLIITTLFLVAAGVVMVYSTSYVLALNRFGDGYFFVKKQLAIALAGVAFFVIATRVHYRIYRKLTYPILILAVLLLCLIFVPGIGHEVGGARRWVNIGGFAFQPSEPAKLAVIVFLAYSLAAKKDRIRGFSTGFLPNVLIPGVIVVLIMAEPDFGTAVALGLLVFIMNFTGGVRVGYLAGLTVLSLPVLYLVVTNFGYMTRRILAFLDPWKDSDGAGFQMVQSFLAFGSGGIWGVGLGEGKQKLFYLPEAHTDFIFSVIGEELGLVGVATAIVLYILFLVGGTRAALKAKDLFGTYLALGLTFMVVLQAALNMAIVLGILPPKGLPLPFISYGGTSLMVNMFAVGIIINIYINGNEA